MQPMKGLSLWLHNYFASVIIDITTATQKAEKFIYIIANTNKHSRLKQLQSFKQGLLFSQIIHINKIIIIN